MKSDVNGNDCGSELPHPVRGAWVEITLGLTSTSHRITPHPVRGAWVEINVDITDKIRVMAAPREGCVG